MTDYELFSKRLFYAINDIKNFKLERKRVIRNNDCDYWIKKYYKFQLNKSRDNYRFYLNRLHAIDLYTDEVVDIRIKKMIRNLSRRYK